MAGTAWGITLMITYFHCYYDISSIVAYLVVFIL